jgi:DNA polymerase-3 subunit alpha
MPLPEVDRIARLIPTLPGKPLKFDDLLGDDPEKALPELKEVYNNDEHAHKLIDTARQLEGITRHASTHAAGVIVADKPLVEYIPLHRPTKGSAEDAPVKQVTQFPMETCESIGLLKVDFLGLSTLTIMRRACELIEHYHGIHYDLSSIPYRADPDDPEQARMVAEMFEMIGRGETVGVFQLESQGMRRMLTDMRPSRFEHIVAGISLYRPGPLEYIPTYNRRLHGEEKIEYKHDLLRPILEETYGIIVYQEQLMEIGAELFGYELGEADLMRRAVSKKKKEALQQHRQLFVERGPEHGVDPDAANAIFDDIEFFARYGFNKSHAADYAVLTCQTAFLKCHYPHEYMAALMSVHRDDAGKVGLFAADCARMGIDVLPPTVNSSELDFSIEEHGDGRAIRFGLGAIKNLGVGPVEHILEQRGAGGRFRDLEDFCQRVDTRTVNKRALESLIKVGALDEFAPRPTLLAALDRIVSFSADYHKAKDVGQMSLFGDATGVDFGTVDNILGAVRDVEPVSRREMLNWEKELVGLYVTDHPLRPLAEQFAHANLTPAAELIEGGEALNGQPVSIAGLVTNIRSFPTKKGDMMAILTVEDITGTITAVLFPRTWGEYRDLIDEDAVVVVKGKADTSRGDIQVIADSVQQNFEFATAVSAPPAMDQPFSWIADEDSDDDDELLRGDDDDSGEAITRDEPPEAPVSPPPPSPPRSTIIDDREMPGWLEDELDNGWSPPPDLEYHDDTGHVVGESEPDVYHDDRVVKPPPAAAARPRTDADAGPPRETARLRRKPAPPEPAPAPPPGRLLTLYIQRTGDTEKDQRRLKFIHGRVSEFPGHDHFRFVLEGDDKPPVTMNFPKHPIEINDEVMAFVIEKLGEDNVMVTED